MAKPKSGSSKKTLGLSTDQQDSGLSTGQQTCGLSSDPPTPGLSTVPLTVQPTPGLSAKPLTVQPTPWLSAKPLTVQPTPGLSAVPLTVQPTPGLSTVPLTVQPTPGLSAVPLTVQPAPGLSAVPLTVQPKPGLSTEPLTDQPTPLRPSKYPTKDEPSPGILQEHDYTCPTSAEKSDISLQQNTTSSSDGACDARADDGSAELRGKQLVSVASQTQEESATSEAGSRDQPTNTVDYCRNCSDLERPAPVKRSPVGNTGSQTLEAATSPLAQKVVTSLRVLGRITDPHGQGGAARPDTDEGALSPYMVAVADTADIEEVEKSQIDFVGNKPDSDIYDIRSLDPVKTKLLDPEQSLRLTESCKQDSPQKVDAQNLPYTDTKQAQSRGNKLTTPPVANSNAQITPPDADSNTLTAPPDADNNTLTAPPDAYSNAQITPPDADSNTLTAPPDADSNTLTAPLDADSDTVTTQPDVDSGDKRYEGRTMPCAKKMRNGEYKKNPDLKSESGPERAPTPESENPRAQGGPLTPSSGHLAPRARREGADKTTEQNTLASIPEKIPDKIESSELTCCDERTKEINERNRQKTCEANQGVEQGDAKDLLIIKESTELLSDDIATLSRQLVQIMNKTAVTSPSAPRCSNAARDDAKQVDVIKTKHRKGRKRGKTKGRKDDADPQCDKVEVGSRMEATVNANLQLNRAKLDGVTSDSKLGSRRQTNFASKVDLSQRLVVNSVTRAATESVTKAAAGSIMRVASESITRANADSVTRRAADSVTRDTGAVNLKQSAPESPKKQLDFSTAPQGPNAIPTNINKLTSRVERISNQARRSPRENVEIKKAVDKKLEAGCKHKTNVYLKKGRKQGKSKLPEGDIDQILKEFEQEMSSVCSQCEEEAKRTRARSLEQQRQQQTRHQQPPQARSRNADLCEISIDDVIKMEEYKKQGARPKVIKGQATTSSKRGNRKSKDTDSHRETGLPNQPATGERWPVWQDPFEEWSNQMDERAIAGKEKAKYIFKVREALEFIRYFRPYGYGVDEMKQIYTPASLEPNNDFVLVSDYADLFLLHDLLPYNQPSADHELSQLYVEPLVVSGSSLFPGRRSLSVGGGSFHAEGSLLMRAGGPSPTAPGPPLPLLEGCERLPSFSQAFSTNPSATTNSNRSCNEDGKSAGPAIKISQPAEEVDAPSNAIASHETQTQSIVGQKSTHNTSDVTPAPSSPKTLPKTTASPVARDIEIKDPMQGLHRVSRGGPLVCPNCNGAGCGGEKGMCQSELDDARCYSDDEDTDSNASSSSDSTVISFGGEEEEPPPPYEEFACDGNAKGPGPSNSGVGDDPKTWLRPVHTRMHRTPRPRLRKHMNRCMNCRRRKGVHLRSCQRCELAKYCCRECQLEDYSRHKEECKRTARWTRACRRLEPYMYQYMMSYNLKIVTLFRHAPDCYQSLQGYNRALLCEVVGPCQYYPGDDFAIFLADETGNETPLVFSVEDSSYYMPHTDTPLPLELLLYPGRFIILMHPVWVLFEDFREGFRITDLRNLFIIKELSEL